MPHMDAATHRQARENPRPDYTVNYETTDEYKNGLQKQLEYTQDDNDRLYGELESCENRKFLWLSLGMILAFVLLYMYKKVRRN